MESVRFSETLRSTYRAARYHNSEDRIEILMTVETIILLCPRFNSMRFKIYHRNVKMEIYCIDYPPRNIFIIIVTYLWS
jgi:hypothetical protein